MARTTYKTFLMYKETPGTGSQYTKLVDIKSFPDMGGTPEMVEITTLSDSVQTNIPGVQSLDNLEFTANYSAEDYYKIKNMEGTEYDFAVWFGGTAGDDGAVTPDGSEGKFTFKGKLSVFVTGGGVNEVTDMKISIGASTVIGFAKE